MITLDRYGGLAPANESARWQAGANTTNFYAGKHTATPASCAKWLTIWRYTHGYCSLEATQAAIDAHPEWRLARSALAGTT